MPARKAVTWAELRVGLLVLITLAIVATFVFYVTGEGVLFANQISYITYLPDVAGLKPGAPVRLAGFEVGVVESIGLHDFREDPSRKAEVRFRIQEKYRKYIREDSLVFITTEGLLGESVLEIDPSLTGEMVAAGGVVPGTQRGNIKEIVQNVNRITDDVRTLIGDVRAGKGTFGKLLTDPELYDRATHVVDDMQSLTERAAAGEGSLGKLMVSTELYDQLKGVANTLDEAAQNVRAGKGTLGALIYDDKFYKDASGVVERVDNVVAKVEAGQGTLGKLITDDKLYNDTQVTMANAREITRKFNEGEGTFGRAVNDPRLYENVNKFTTELRALISDFRKNPKEYLRIKFSIF
jgi:phospholipid/cholesterol/gamma-HCH transport system substrate-binding protein